MVKEIDVLIDIKEKNKHLLDNYKKILSDLERRENSIIAKVHANHEFIKFLNAVFNESRDNYHKIASNNIK